MDNEYNEVFCHERALIVATIVVVQMRLAICYLVINFAYIDDLAGEGAWMPSPSNPDPHGLKSFQARAQMLVDSGVKKALEEVHSCSSCS